MILVTGAAGKTGRAIIKALTGRKAAVRAFIKRPEHLKVVKEAGADEVHVGDMLDAETFDKAAAGVASVYHLAPNVSPEEVEIGKLSIEAARKASVRQFVYHSVLHPQTEEMPHHWKKMRVEELVFASGLDFTILQPAAYMQNVLAAMDGVFERGVYQVPYAEKTRLGMVDLNDVAEAAAVVLLEPGHKGAIYELCGPDVLTQTEIASILGEHLKMPVKAEQLPITNWAMLARSAGLGTYQVATLLKMFLYYEQYGFWGNPRVLGWILQREPKSFREFVKGIKPR